MSAPGQNLRAAAVILIALAFFLPLWWVTISALRPEDEIFRYLSPVSWKTVLPSRISLDSMIGVWHSDFTRAILNSVFVSAVTVIVGLCISAAAAFALAVMEFPGRAAVFTIVVVSFLIPFDAIALPLYTIMRGLHLQNSYVGLILPGIGNGLAVFLLRQFFLGIPKELREAGMIDGMGWFGVFYRIYLPLSGHALVSAGLILFVFQWQAYLWPLLIAPAPTYKVASVSIAQFATSDDIRYGLIFSGAFFISVIPMLVLVCFQRYYTASMASTGSKE